MEKWAIVKLIPTVHFPYLYLSTSHFKFLSIQAFWVVTPRRQVNIYRHFEERNITILRVKKSKKTLDSEDESNSL